MLVLGLLLLLVLAIFFVGLSSADRTVLFNSSKSLQVGSDTRTYRLYDKGGDADSLIIALHGLGGDSRQIAYFSGLHNVVPRGFVVVYPDAIKPERQGVRPGWNSGFCCGSGWVQGTDDVAYISKLIDTLTNQYGIDKAKVYITGFSSGAMMAHRIAVEIPNKIAGFAAVSGSIGTKGKELKPTVSVPAYLIHGEADTVVAFNGGQGSSDPDFVWTGFADGLSAWANVNGCSNESQVKSGVITRTTYEQCSVELIADTYEGLGHRWPDWRLGNFWHQQPASSKSIVNFFNSLSENLDKPVGKDS